MHDFLPNAIQIIYLVAAALFIVGLKRMSSPATARQGNLLASVGMLLAIVSTLLDHHILNYTLIAAALAVGSAIGAAMAYRVEMTSMPQMVGLLNGLGRGSLGLNRAR
jgi:H+-translocating NAD(P) transhydrogenase subunit beta